MFLQQPAPSPTQLLSGFGRIVKAMLEFSTTDQSAVDFHCPNSPDRLKQFVLGLKQPLAPSI
jgi:hypothetical protein